MNKLKFVLPVIFSILLIPSTLTALETELESYSVGTFTFDGHDYCRIELDFKLTNNDSQYHKEADLWFGLYYQSSEEIRQFKVGPHILKPNQTERFTPIVLYPKECPSEEKEVTDVFISGEYIITFTYENSQ